MLRLFSGGNSTEDIDVELPFAVMMFTTLAASGVTLYESWKKCATLTCCRKSKQMPKTWSGK
jgi:hypothetical protein